MGRISERSAVRRVIVTAALSVSALVGFAGVASAAGYTAYLTGHYGPTIPYDRYGLRR